MKLIDDVMKKKVPVPERLKAYGFKEEGDKLVYRRTLIDTFMALVIVKEGKVDGNVIDAETEEVYMPLQYGTGSYAVRIREAFVSLIEEIADQCCDDVLFASAQADRLTSWIRQTYGETPDFPFADDDESGVFRLKGSRKWYALIMTIDSTHLGGKDHHDISIINLKVQPERRDALLMQEGIYPAYHMNPQHWITVLLDDAVGDEALHELVEASRQLVMGKTFIRHGAQAWIIPSNPKYFDIVSYYQNRSTSLWRMYPSIQEGDTVYIYVGAPCQAIMYRCVVKKTDVPSEEAHPCMLMDITDKYDPSLCTRKGMMARHGVTNVRGPRRMPSSLEEEIKANSSKE
jgi:predicted DNA-binding protein (MmcQ/YjbR family)